MIGPEQDLNDFPPWIWPYINVARIAEIGQIKDVSRTDVGDARIPQAAINAHMMAIISALTMKKVAAGLGGDLGKQFATSANQALTVAIDDCGNTGPKPWRKPPKHIVLMQIAGHLAVAAAELEGDEVLHNGLKAAAAVLVKQAGQ